MKKDSKNSSSSSKASNSKTSKNSSSSSKTASKADKSSSSSSSGSSKSNKKTEKNKKANDDNNNDDDDDNDEVVTSLSSDTIKFLEMLAMRLPHKSPSSSSSLQLMMAACDAIQGTVVATEIASNPKHSLQIFEEAFSKKDEEIQHDNNDDSIDNDNIVTLINTNNISQLISINDNNNITIDSLISIVNKNNFHNDHQKLAQHLITYHNNHKDTGTLSNFVNILSQKLSSYIVFSSNDDSDTNGDDIESDSCIWAYVTVMSITNNNTASITKIISTLHLLTIDNPEASFMCMGYLGYWGIRLSSNDYDDSNMQLLIQSITSLLNAYLQSIHMKVSSDPGIDIEMLILSPVVLYCWLSKLKGSSSSLSSLKDLLLSYLTVVAQSTANIWSTLHTILKDTDSIKIDKDITNRGYEIGKKGLKELLSWICSKAGLLDSACAAMTEGLMPTIAPTKTTKKSKKGEEKTSDIQLTLENDEIVDENDDDAADDDEPLTFSIDNTRDDSILKSLENDENYMNEEPNLELEQELKKAQEQQMKKKKKKTTSNDDAGNDAGNDKKKRKVR